MDAKTLRGKNAKALQKELEDAQTHLKELEFKRSSNQLKNVRDLRATKKTIARIRTILNQEVEKQTTEKSES